MERSNDIKSIHSYLSSQRDKYIKQLLKIGVKLARNGSFDEKSFIQSYIPNKDFIIQKIKEKVESDNEYSKDAELCMESYLYHALKKEIDLFCSEIGDLRKNTTTEIPNKDNSERSSDTMKTASDCGNRESFEIDSSSRRNLKNEDDLKRSNDRNAVLLSQELFPGERTNIFVQKSNINVERKKLQEYESDGSIIEKISIIRHVKK